jgi:nicotinamidase-related amidase
MRRAALIGLALLAIPAARAQDVVAQWARVEAPPAPSLRHVTLNPRRTALLLLDFASQTCNHQRRPRCVASIPAVAALLKRARASHAAIIYSGVIGGTAADVAPMLARRGNEPMVFSGPDKFLHTRLGTLLRQDKISTVIVTGTAAEGAVLATASEAAYRGYHVIVPADGISAATLYPEQYVAWDMLHAPTLMQRARLTSTRLISFSP